MSIIGRQDRSAPAARRVTVAELGGLFVFVAAVMVVTTIPYLYGYRSTPAGKQFMGILLNVPDTAQYLSWARESSQRLLIENKLTSEHGPAVFFNPFWLVVGRLAVLLRLSFAEALQVVRPVTGAIYLVAAFWFIALVTGDRTERWVSFLVVTLGGGLGWLEVVLKAVTRKAPAPLDLYVYEPNTLLSVLAFPLQAMADGLLVLILGLVALAFERKSARLAILVGFLSLILGFAHGYDLVITYAVTGTVALALAIRDRDLLRPVRLAVIVGVISCPAAFYVFLLSRLSPIWQGVLAQYGNAGVFTPSPAHLLILMGVPLILLVVTPGERPDLQKARAREILLASWLVVGFALLYIPTNFQIKMLGGWQVPVGILATRATLTRAVPGVKGFFKRHGWRPLIRPELVVGCLLIAAVVTTNLYLYAWRFVDLGRHEAPYYLSRGEVDALHWLEASSNPSDVVLSSLTIGEYVPSVSGNNAFLAHWAMTLDYFGKRRLVGEFFNGGGSDAARRAIVDRYNVRYVYYGPAERALGSYNPDTSPWLTKVFSNGGVSVYRIGKEVHPTVTGSQP